MTELYLADSLSFDYSKLKDKKIDLIFTNPPAFDPVKQLFANNMDQHVARMLTWFRGVRDQLNIPLVYIHLTHGHFISMTPKKEILIEFPIQEVKYKTSKCTLFQKLACINFSMSI